MSVILKMSQLLKILEGSKGFTKTTKNETKEQIRGFSWMLLGILVASLLGNMLTWKRNVRSWL